MRVSCCCYNKKVEYELRRYKSNEKMRYEKTFFKDHLGSVRATVSKDASSLVSVEHTNDYYPFGSAFNSSVSDLGAYRHAYQGDFADQDQETGYLSFDLRLLDSRLGRWLSTDPYRQFHSPYVSMANNPVNAIDPDGGFASGFIYCYLSQKKRETRKVSLFVERGE